MMGSFGRILRPVFDSGVAVAPPWWQVAGKTCVAAYQPKGAASLAASYVNLATPGTYDAAQGVAPTLGADGWTFNGSTQYLTTGVVPASDQTWSMLLRFSGRTNDSSPSRVTDIAVTIHRFGFYLDNTNVYFCNGTTPAGVVSAAPALTSGVIAVAGSVGYRNGAIDASGIGGFTGTIDRALLIGSSSGPSLNFAGNIQAIAIYSATLTAGEVAVVSAAMAAL